MQYTPNYNLNLPELDEQYNLNDWNHNTEEIDRQLKETNDDLSLEKNTTNSHREDKANPHEVTKEQVGLGNVDNKSFNDIIPIGFIYIQFPNQLEPNELWQGTTWENISSEYNGAFFRAEGGLASGFNSGAQGGALGEHDHAFTRTYGSGTGNVSEMNVRTAAGNPGTGDINVLGGDGSAGAWSAFKIQKTGSNETRPYNYTIRIWKRIA